MKRNNIKLDTIQIKKILKAIDRTKAWLARQTSTSHELVAYDLRTGCPKRVGAYAKALGLDKPEKLLKIK